MKLGEHETRELSRIPLFGQYAELHTKMALAWRALPRPEAPTLGSCACWLT